MFCSYLATNLNVRQAAEIRANTRSRVKLSYTVHSTAQVCLQSTTLTALESSSKETDVSLCHSDTHQLLLQCLYFGQHTSTDTNIKGILHRLAMSFDYYNNHHQCVFFSPSCLSSLPAGPPQSYASLFPHVNKKHH